MFCGLIPPVLFYIAIVAALRYPTEGKEASPFTVRINGPAFDVSSSFTGAGEVEMNEATFQCGKQDTLSVVVGEEGIEHHKIDFTMEQIRAQADWSILLVENFEVRVQFLLSEPLPPDFLDTAFDKLSGPKAWYFKAEDLYVLLKSITQQLKLPSQLGVTSEELVARVSKLVDSATEAVMKRFTNLSAQEERHVLQSIDELLTTQLTVFDSMVDSSRVKLVESLRKLRSSLQDSIKEHRQYVETTIDNTVSSAKDLHSKTMDNVTTSMEAMTTGAKAGIEEAKGRAEGYKSEVQGRVDDYKAQVDGHVQHVKSKVTERVHTFSAESKAWATAFLDARVVQGKEALDTAQPYVLQAVGATQPYASRVVTAAKPYVDMAMPYVENAKKRAEENQYVGPYVAPVLDTANAVLDSAKTYMGLNAPEPTVGGAAAGVAAEVVNGAEEAVAVVVPAAQEQTASN